MNTFNQMKVHVFFPFDADDFYRQKNYTISQNKKKLSISLSKDINRSEAK